MEIVTGGITTGEDFFEGRKQYVDELGHLLETNDVLLVGPRRTGKTSLIKQFLIQEKDKGKICLYLNLEDTKGLYEFYVRVIREVLFLTDKMGLLADQTGEFIKGTCNKLNQIFQGKVKLPADALGTNVEAALEVSIPKFDPQTIEALQEELNAVLSNVKQQLIIVLDEFPELIFKFPEDVKKERTKLLMSGLRSVRQKLAVDQKKNHKVIVAGSVNLENTINSLGLSETINDLPPLKIPNLSPEECYQLLNKLAVSAEFKFASEEETKAFILKQFSYSTPFYIQLFADNLRNIKRQRRVDTFDGSHLKDAYKVLIQGDRGPNYFLKRVDNINYYSAEEKAQVLTILKQIAKKQFDMEIATTDDEVKALITDSLARKRLLTKLGLDDFFQIGDGGNYKFDCQVICNFWHYSLNDGSYLK